jgi:hypothetical protein
MERVALTGSLKSKIGNLIFVTPEMKSFKSKSQNILLGDPAART